MTSTSLASAATVIRRGVELLLLVRCEERTNLRERVVHHGLRFLHRLPTNAFNLRRRLVDNWLDLGFLVRSEIQVFGHLLK